MANFNGDLDKTACCCKKANKAIKKIQSNINALQVPTANFATLAEATAAFTNLVNILKG